MSKRSLSKNMLTNQHNNQKAIGRVAQQIEWKVEEMNNKAGKPKKERD